MIIKATPSYPRVEDILARVQPALSEEQAAHVRRAYDIAEAAHEGQQRASGEPYFSHCAEVTMLLADLVADWPTLAAGLLHDTIEDCGFTEKKIEGLMPAPVAELVDGVTKVSKIHFATDREHQAGNLRKMILAMARDVRVVLIKLCDRLHNMRTLGYLEPGRRKIIATGTIEIYAPLANRLGMESISDELEDLAMSHLQPVIFKRLGDHLKRNKEHYEGIIEQTVEIVRDALGRDGVSADVSARLKHIYSIYEKMRRQSLGLSEIHDLLAMRIITATVAETYEALGIVHAKWKPVEGRFKDYIASPKPNGYRSIHTTVIGVEGELTEIQLRTREMDKIAAEGVAAHWKYKEAGSEKSAEDVEAKKLAWLRQLVDWLSDIRDPDEFMAAIKHDVFEASVFCYTPVGDVVELPRGSSVPDFA
ncbi:bifunctional (p)ppGpp synthetase/guanosine-3',5'-bis(diphosphate) 3'-pyrophosphohydrolase, partial [Candidatus Sumerlaeota bacterium]|nr:bifunctional (p)ppGpp synthetase/guanosine-3',5'-bis(diphosphate) 3'-pyrophosphohydrolase [Candidatus Sumerlaeota bacterium]